jgi:hypothetical protein
VEALKSGAGEPALALVKQIDELYTIEREAQERAYHDPARLLPLRPVSSNLQASQTRFEQLKQTELPSSHLGDAARYALNHWQELVRYAKPGYGHIHIDQNPIEGNIRQFGSAQLADQAVLSPSRGARSL